MKLSQAIEGFFLDNYHLSPHTVADYRNTFRKLTDYLSDPQLEEITPPTISEFLAEMRKPQDVHGCVNRTKALSEKTLLNYHTALCSLWTWATQEGITDTHIMRSVSRPKPKKRAIIPLSKHDFAAMISACEEVEYRRAGKAISRERSTAIRDKAIIRLLLDTGLRASELCKATVADLDLGNNRLKVLGKGNKERVLAIGKRTVKSLWRYLTERGETVPSDPIFVQEDNETPMNRGALYLLTTRLGKRAGVTGTTNPHRFRHTFAINCLRNGCDVYTLQAMLGHTTLDMVRTYLAIAQADIENAHRKVSPVDTWKV